MEPSPTPSSQPQQSGQGLPLPKPPMPKPAAPSAPGPVPSQPAPAQPSAPQTAPPPTPGAPVPTPAQPSVAGGSELSELSPFKVLKKDGPPQAQTPPVQSAAPSPAPAQPAAPVPQASMSREELLRQAAEAPDHHLIVPPVAVQQPAKPAFVPPVIPTGEKATPVPETKDPTGKFAGIVTESRAGAKPEAERPVKPVDPNHKPVLEKILATPVPSIAPAPDETAQKPVTMELPKQGAGKQRTSDPEVTGKIRRATAALIGFAGLVLAIVVVGGVAYALVLQGLRVPVIYTFATNLSTQGLQVAKDASAKIATAATYHGNGEITVKAQAGSGKPDLPDSTGSAPSTGGWATTFGSTVTSISTQAADDTFIESTGLAVGARAGVPIILRSGVSGGSKWLAYLPAATIPTPVTLERDELSGTLVYSLFRPMPLPAILAAVQQDTEYEKVLVRNQNAARFHYNLNSTKLTGYIPNGASVSQSTAQIDYAWKTNLPVHAQVSVVFKYAGQSYEYKSVMDYVDFGAKAGPAGRIEFAPLTDADPTAAKPMKVKDLLTALGTSLDEVPNTLDGKVITSSDDASGGTPTPATSSTPAPTAAATATAVPTPTPSAVAAPSGQYVTSTQTAITKVPPTPAAVATTDAKARDSQRLKDLASLQSALESYKTKNGSYPKTNGIEQTRASATLVNALVPTYMTGIPVDPLKDTYWYEYSSDGSGYRIRSVAEDATNPSAKKGLQYSYFEISK